MTADSIRVRRICDRKIKKGDRAWVESLLDKALAKIAAGNGQVSPLESTLLNGKSFSRTILLSSLDVADIAQAALDEADGEASSEATGITVPDFSA